MNAFKLMGIFSIVMISAPILCGKNGLSKNERDARALALKVAARRGYVVKDKHARIDAERQRLDRKRGGGAKVDNRDLSVVQKALHDRELADRKQRERAKRRELALVNAVRNKRLFEERMARLAHREAMRLALLVAPDQALSFLREWIS